MKKLYSITLLTGILFSVLSANAQSWVPVGTSGFSPGAVNGLSLAIHVNTPYVAFADNANAGKAMVMKFDGSNWVTVGSPDFSASGAGSICIAIDKNGTPYVAYTDGAINNQETVMKYNGSDWAVVGTAGFSPKIWYNNCLAIDTNGVPYVAFFEDYGACCQGHTHVMKFDGASWIEVGGLIDGTDWLTMALDTNNVPYLGFNDTGFHMPDNYYYNGTSWTGIFSGLNDQSYFGALNIDRKNNIPYLAISDGLFSGKATVYRCNGSSWSIVGTAGFTGSWNANPSIAIDSSGTPYISYIEYSSRYMNVMNYNGSSWLNVGSTTDSCQYNNWAHISFDKNNIPYVAFVDAAHGDGATVLKYDISSGIAENNNAPVSIYPNPFTNALSIKGIKEKGEVILYDVMGEEMLRQKITEGETKLNTENISSGFYLLHYSDGKTTENLKVVKQ